MLFITVCLLRRMESISVRYYFPALTFWISIIIQNIMKSTFVKYNWKVIQYQQSISTSTNTIKSYPVYIFWRNLILMKIKTFSCWNTETSFHDVVPYFDRYSTAIVIWIAFRSIPLFLRIIWYDPVLTAFWGRIECSYSISSFHQVSVAS